MESAWQRAVGALAATPTGEIVLYDGQQLSAYSISKKKGTHVMVAHIRPGWFTMKCESGTYGPFDSAKTTLLDVAFDHKFGNDPRYERVEGKKAGTRSYRKKGTTGRGTTINVNMYSPDTLYVGLRPGTPKRTAPSSSAGTAKKTHLEPQLPALSREDAEDVANLLHDDGLPSDIDDVFGPPPPLAPSSDDDDDELKQFLSLAEDAGQSRDADGLLEFDRLVAACVENPV